jgi:OmpA-OmpF porin, OOP family
VITPFTLRFVLDAEGARFDSCSADTDRAQAQILRRPPRRA